MYSVQLPGESISSVSIWRRAGCGCKVSPQARCRARTSQRPQGWTHLFLQQGRTLRVVRADGIVQGRKPPHVSQPRRCCRSVHLEERDDGAIARNGRVVQRGAPLVVAQPDLCGNRERSSRRAFTCWAGRLVAGQTVRQGSAARANEKLEPRAPVLWPPAAVQRSRSCAILGNKRCARPIDPQYSAGARLPSSPKGTPRLIHILVLDRNHQQRVVVAVDFIHLYNAVFQPLLDRRERVVVVRIPHHLEDQPGLVRRTSSPSEISGLSGLTCSRRAQREGAPPKRATSRRRRRGERGANVCRRQRMPEARRPSAARHPQRTFAPDTPEMLIPFWSHKHCDAKSKGVGGGVVAVVGMCAQAPRTSTCQTPSPT